MVHLQDARKWVCNPDGVLSNAATDSIDRYLTLIHQTKGVQSVVVAVKRLEGGDTYEFGMALAKKYGIGQKEQNSGLIILLSTEDREYRILTGEGIEGALPDAICKRILNRYMLPHLKAAEWDDAMLQTVKAAVGYLENDEGLLPEDEESDGNDLPALISLVSFTLILLYSLFLAQYRRCPSCGKRRLRATTRTYLYRNGDWEYYRIVYVCSHCRYSETKVERRPRDRGNNGSGGIYIGGGLGSGMGSGHWGGGGFGGGSFGGGSFGGGGAGGHF